MKITKTRAMIAYYGYWVLFIVIPALCPFFLISLSNGSIVVSIVILIVCAAIGERGVQIWLKLLFKNDNKDEH